MKLVHLCAVIDDGIEFLSRCENHHHHYETNDENWIENTIGFGEHKKCDLCEFDNGKELFRLSALMKEGLIK